MFFRRTKVANGLDGKSYYTYRLVENQREGTKFRQKTMLNLGANRGVPQSDWKAVAQRVEAIQHGQISCFEYPKRIESAAQSVVNRLRARDLNGDKLGTGSVVTVDLDTMKHTDVRPVGCERLCLQALEDLQLGRILDELGMSEPDTRRALALVAAKMIHPASERETSRWIKDNSSLPELLGLTRSRDLERKTLYRIGDCLWKRQAEIEKHLFRRERDLLNIPATIVFHDLSNTHCTGQHHDQGLRRFGRSKQRRNDCPLVTLALVLDEKGFPRSSEVLPGNVGEAKTLEAALKNLEEVHGCRDPNNRPTVIMDAGIATDDNLKFLKENGYGWICISKKARVAPPDRAPDSTLHTKAKHLVEAWRISDKDADELKLYAPSEGRSQTEASILARQRSKLEAELQYLHDGLSLPRRMKRHDRCGMPCNYVPLRGKITSKFDPLFLVVETPFHQATMERQTGMICVEKIGMVRRFYFVEKKSIKEICRLLKINRGTVRKIVRSGATEFKYVRKSQPYPKLGPWRERLEKILEENEALPKKQRRRMTRIWKELVNDGYDGGYASVCRYAKKWRIAHGKQQAKAFIPLIFDPGEAYQFDWSEEKVVMAGELTTVKVVHFKLSHSRMPFSIAYPRETQEMVFDAHDEAFKFFDGCCGKGIYDNMSTAVDAVLRGKDRKFNKTFLQMCSHHMVEPVACSPAAGWEKGQVENLVKETREYSLKPRLEVADLDELNARLKKDAVERARELRHPENPDLTVWEMFQQEQAFLTPLQKPFVGFCEKTVAVTRTCLINFDRNKYSVQSRAVGGPVQLQVYATRIVLRQNGEIVGEHERCFGRNKTIFNPWHYVPILKRKPGALRNGAPFRDWDLPPAMTRVWNHLSDVSDGDRQMVDILFAAHEHNTDVVEAACAEALEAGLRGAEAILNIVSRRTNPPPPKPIEPPAHLRLKMVPTADCSRYDRLGGTHAVA